ncbi:hypothetical protein [Paeniglutamicibacter sp. NPDC091659]|uniref:hypothetical protein n=1 Tax=Paeniglutamicibacter sp. NPDC091659 TaxID=3364389 RepID=UPI003809D67A
MDQTPQDLTAKQYKALTKSAGNYWVTQFAACVLFMLMGFAGVVAAWGYGIGFSGDDAAGGDGLMALFIASLFVGCFVYLLKIRKRSTGLGKLRFAWVIRQTEHATIANFRNVGRDMAALALAQKASKDELTKEELAGLQAMDPEFPYPWRIPPS